MRCVRMKGDIKVLLGCFLGIVLLALLVVACKETDAKGGHGRVWKLYLKGDEYYMEWLGVEMLMMSTHQLIDSLYTNSMKYQQYRVCIERINDSLFACSFYQDIPTKWLLLRMYYDKDYKLTAIQREEAFVDYECER